jgi:VWFA-related protein
MKRSRNCRNVAVGVAGVLSGITALGVLVALGARPAMTPLDAFQRPTSNHVALDVIVTDAKSRPMQDLKAADFELIDSGEARTVDDVRSQSGGARVFGIFLDEFHVRSGIQTTRARDALLTFVDTQLRDDDLVAIVKPLDPLHAISFTQDRRVIRQVITAFEGHAGDYTPRSEFERNFMSRDPKTAEPARAQVVSAALIALARRLGDQNDGRKALVLVSEGFRPAQPRAIVYAANRNHVSIHPVDPGPDPADHDAMLRTLAEQTAGYASVNEADLGAAFTQATTDLDHQLIVTFESDSPEDGRFRPVQVRVKRPGAQIRARTGYWTVDAAVEAAIAKANAPRPTVPFRMSRSSPYIRPWVGMSRGADGLTRVTVTWEPGQTPPRNQRVVGIELKATASDGQVIFEQRLGPGDTERAVFDAPPGSVAIEMAIQSSSGAALDTDYRTVSVPNLQVTKPTFATPQVFRTRNARQFVEVSQDPEAVPSASRSFSRTERLLVRIPAYGAGDTQLVVTARLLNRRGASMRVLPSVAAPLAPHLVQFDLPLASLAPDEYRVELSATNPTGPRDEVKEILTFRVTD